MLENQINCRRELAVGRGWQQQSNAKSPIADVEIWVPTLDIQQRHYTVVVDIQTKGTMVHTEYVPGPAYEQWCKRPHYTKNAELCSCETRVPAMAAVLTDHIEWRSMPCFAIQKELH